MTAKPKWIVERGSFEAPQVLDVEERGWIWRDDPAQAFVFGSEEDATRAASETGVDELRITEKDE